MAFRMIWGSSSVLSWTRSLLFWIWSSVSRFYKVVCPDFSTASRNDLGMALWHILDNEVCHDFCLAACQVLSVVFRTSEWSEPAFLHCILPKIMLHCIFLHCIWTRSHVMDLSKSVVINWAHSSVMFWVWFSVLIGTSSLVVILATPHAMH